MAEYRMVEEKVKAYMERALLTYPLEHYGQLLPVLGEGLPFLSAFLFENGPTGLINLIYGGYTFQDLDPVPLGKTRVVLSHGTWYQPAYARYDGPEGQWYASLKGEGPDDYHYTGCTLLRDHLPYRDGHYHGPQNMNLWYRNVLYEYEQLRAHSIPRKQSLQYIGETLKQLEMKRDWDVRPGYYDLPPYDGSYVYPSSLRFTVNLPGAEMFDIKFPQDYCWEMMMAFNQNMAITGKQFDANVAQYGKTYWDERFMASKTVTMGMLDLCLAVATYGVPSFCEHYQRTFGHTIPRCIQEDAHRIADGMIGCLGDLWPILLFDFSQHRVPAKCRYQR